MPTPTDIFKWRELTDFEKNLFLKSQVKELKSELSKQMFENGVLRSELDEALHNSKKARRVNSLQKEVKTWKNRAINYRDLYEKLTQELITLKNQ